MRPAPFVAVLLNAGPRTGSFIDAVLALVHNERGERPRWATDEVLVLVDALNDLGVRRRDFDLLAPTPMGAIDDVDIRWWPRDPGRHVHTPGEPEGWPGSDCNTHRWEWWAFRGFVPDPWTEADTAAWTARAIAAGATW